MIQTARTQTAGAEVDQAREAVDVKQTTVAHHSIGDHLCQELTAKVLHLPGFRVMQQEAVDLVLQTGLHQSLMIRCRVHQVSPRERC